MHQLVNLRFFSILSTIFILTIMTAVAYTPCEASPDTFDLSSHKTFVGNVLSNDQGSKLKVVSTSETINGGKAVVYSKGDFYYKPTKNSKIKTSDSFTYTIVDKFGHKSTSKVIINFSKNRESKGIANVMEVTQLEQIDKALKKGPVLLKIGAEWCACCQELDPAINELATEYRGKATILSIDIDKSPELVDYFGVSSIPDSCLIVDKDNGKYVYLQDDDSVTKDRSHARIIGSQDKAVFEKRLNFVERDKGLSSFY